MLFGKEFDKQISFVGLANAGKTTLVKKLKADDEDIEITEKYNPTMGLSMETFKLNSIEVVAADLGGQKSFQETFWKPFVSKSAAIVFVFDSADESNVKEAGEVLSKLLTWVRSDSAFLFLANKMDKENSLPLDEIIELLRLKEKIPEKVHSFGVYQISALLGDNLEEPINWLSDQLMKMDEGFPKKEESS
jgi:small GTP-binding protein